jgi:hypothetical protein
MPLRTFAVICLLAAGLAGNAAADGIVTTNVIDFGADVNIFAGTVELYSADGQLLSTTSALTVETGFGVTGSISSYSALDSAFPLYLPLVGQFIVQEIQTNAYSIYGINIPSRFGTNLQNFVDSNILGITSAIDPRLLPGYPNTPASQQLYGILTAQSVPFVITSDTGDVELTSDTGDLTNPAGDPPPPGKLGDLQYFFGPVNGLPADPNNTVEGLIDLKLFDRDIHIQEVAAVPEPNLLTAFGLCGLVLYGWRRRTSRD